MSLDLSTDSSTASDIAAARQTDQIAFLHRVPFTLDAYKLGFLPGFREDCGYQETQYQNLSIPVGMLDNDFRNPDLERFVDRFFEYEPEVGVIGDVDEIDDVDAHVAAAREIQASYPEAELIVVPKSQAVIDAIPGDPRPRVFTGIRRPLGPRVLRPSRLEGGASTSSVGVRQSSSTPFDS